MIIHYALIFFAALFKAVADTLADHFSTSIFSNWNNQYWDKNQSWRFVKFLPLTSYRPDGWHLSNSLMIFSFVAAACFQGYFSAWYWNILVDGTGFVVVFNIFYNKLLKK